MVSLLTQIVAGGYIDVPAVDPRLTAHINDPVANQTETMPAASVDEVTTEVKAESATAETEAVNEATDEGTLGLG